MGSTRLLSPSRRSTGTWREREGVITFSVTSDGTTGPQWIQRLKEKGVQLDDDVEDILRSPRFQATSGIKTAVAILKGSLFADHERTTKKVRAEGSRRELTILDPEAACLIREMFTDEDMEAMGLSRIVVMHHPIEDLYGESRILDVNRKGSGRLLSGRYGGSALLWNRDSAFAFTFHRWE